MIKIEYNRLTNTTKVLTEQIDSIFFEEKILVRFRNIITDEIHYEVFLGPHSWCNWTGAELITDIEFCDSRGNIIFKYLWDILRDGDLIEKALWMYLKNRKMNNIKSNGLVIGSHDGRNGHWIYSIKDNLSHATLIDGSEKQFNELVKNYSNKENLKFINEIVTVDGGEVTWYQGGEGYTDTVVKELINEWLTESQITQNKKDSISFKKLIEENNFDWIHLDVEGIDGDLILSLEKLPNIIIYESMNLSQEMTDKLNLWFLENQYITLIENGNTIAKKI